MPPTAQRGAAKVSPMNRTGQVFQQQLREKQAKDAAEAVDIEAVKRQEFERGHASGYDMGFEAYGRALLSMYRADGIQAVQELLAELEASEDAAQS